MANELTREAVAGRYEARRQPRADSVRLQRLIGRARLPYSAGALRMLGLLWLVSIFVAVLWDFLPVP